MHERRPQRPRGLRLWRWIVAYRYPLLFGLALIALAALISWWAFYIYRSSEEHHAARYQTLDLEARIYSMMFGHARSLDAVETALSREAVNMALAPCPERLEPLTYPLLPRSENLCISPKEEVISEIERDYRRKKAMLMGEATLSIVLVLLTGFMLFRLVASENRSARELSLLWARVTHELKTPISGLKAFLQTLQNQELSRAEMEPLLKMALAEVERQERMAENLLVGQRLGGRTLSEPGEMVLMPFLLDYLAGQEYRLDKEQLSLDEKCPETVRVRAGAGALRTILDNLVDNSIKYCDKPRLIMTFSVAISSEWARVVVTDNGEGFDPQVSEQIFRAYSRLSDKSGAGRGTGMGLHISRRLAREYGGELEATSTGPGQGAEFTLWLPLVKGG